MANNEVILQELRAFRLEIKEQLEGIKEELTRANNRLEEAEERIEKAEERILNVEEAMTELVQLNIKLEEKMVDMESRSRRENVRIYGVPESSEKDSPSMIAFVETLLREGLELDGVDISIERAHGSLGPASPQDAPPRSIVVKFLSFKIKEQILRKSWQKKGFTWNGKHISLDNDYPPLILKKRKEYAEVRKILKAKQIPFQTLYPARLKVKFTDGEITYASSSEATEDMSRRGYAVKIIKPPETILEQLKQLTWTRVTRGGGSSAAQPGQEPGYKKKLRTFRRTVATTSGT
uniref:L1 transposable element RRM domain-containing protein n=1 Tax=Knipowitschia caucasica TaxID=637954 RepID=A0AAV2M3T8_KNICA